MPDSPSTPPSKFAWYELMTTNTAAAEAFYNSVVGWNTTPVGSPEMPYTTFNLGQTSVAGLMTLPEQAGPIPAWIGYIHVPDVDAYAEKVAATGGTLHRGPIDVPGMLRFAVVIDPQGAPFVLFTPNPSMPSNPVIPAPGTPGTIGWHELLTTDAATAFDWYADLFGWTKAEAVDMGSMGIYQTFAAGSHPIGGVMDAPPPAPGAFWTYYINVESTNAAIERLKAGGGTVVNGPHQVPGGSWIVVAKDPQGATFALVSLAA